jgi:hypothetical protein
VVKIIIKNSVMIINSNYWGFNQMRIAYLMVFDGLSDWEPGLAVAEINKSNDYQVKTVGFNQDVVITMVGFP